MRGCDVRNIRSFHNYQGRPAVPQFKRLSGIPPHGILGQALQGCHTDRDVSPSGYPRGIAALLSLSHRRCMFPQRYQLHEIRQQWKLRIPRPFPADRPVEAEYCVFHYLPTCREQPSCKSVIAPAAPVRRLLLLSLQPAGPTRSLKRIPASSSPCRRCNQSGLHNTGLTTGCWM